MASADALARRANPAHEFLAVEAGQQRADAFNWKAAVARNKKEEALKAAAKNRVRTPSAPSAMPQSTSKYPADLASRKELLDVYRAMHNGELPPDITLEEAQQIDWMAGQQANEGASPKALLDAFRAMNGGALPPGMTPEIAALIDQGMDINAIAAANPAMAGVIAQFQGLINQLPADYAAGKASVNASYNNLTGDVLESGKNWMQDLYGRIVDPNDPNAALAQQDPALAAYGQSMSQIDETSDLNQATDLAWFDKMQQNADATYKGLIASLAAQALAPAEGGGGGGGGGGGRGGRGGGSGGGSINDWKVPTNKLTNQQSATDTATQTDTGFSPGFYEALMEATSGDPELQALTQRMWEGSSQDARGLTQNVSKALTEGETQLENLQLQQGEHQAWLQNTPGTAQAAIQKLLANKPGAVLGDDPKTPQRERYYVPQVEGQTTPQVYVPTPEQTQQNALAEELLAAPSAIPTRQGINKMLRPGYREPHTPVGVLSPEGQIEAQSGGAISPRQIKILAQRGQQALTEAQKGDTTEQPFNWKNWAQGGGFVPEADPEARHETERNIDYYNYILDTILPWNPNATTVPTREQMVSQGQDKSTYNSATSNKSWANALPGSPINLTPGIPTPALQSQPMSNPEGFDITVDDAGDETVEVSPFGQGLGFSIPRGRYDAVRTAGEAVGQDKTKIKDIAKGRLTGFGAFQRPKQPIAPPEKVKPVKPVKAAAKPPPVRPRKPVKDKTKAQKAVAKRTKSKWF